MADTPVMAEAAGMEKGEAMRKTAKVMEAKGVRETAEMAKTETAEMREASKMAEPAEAASAKSTEMAAEPAKMTPKMRPAAASES